MSDMTRPTWICGCGIPHYVGADATGTYKCKFGCDETFTAPNVDGGGNKISAAAPAKKAKADASAS